MSFYDTLATTEDTGLNSAEDTIVSPGSNSTDMMGNSTTRTFLLSDG